MPHIIIECSEQIATILAFEELAPKIHQFLTDTLPTEYANCKTRIVSSSQYLIGGNPKQNFLHVTLKILPGRSPEIKNKVAHTLLEMLNQNISLTNVVLSLEIIEIDTNNYFKLNK